MIPAKPLSTDQRTDRPIADGPVPNRALLNQPEPQNPSAALPALRQELRLHRAPDTEDGAPCWTLEDPLRGQFFQIGWLETELIAHWCRDGQQLLNRVRATTALRPSSAQLAAFVRFLHINQLCVSDTDTLLTQYQQQQKQRTWWRWLFRRHLSFRLPLCRPDPWLTRLLPYVLPLMSMPFLIISAVAGGTGLWLASHQWQQFTHGFSYLFSTKGMLLSALTVIAVKVLHELGHAFSCKKYRGFVATMGVNFILFWPVLYTDVSSAWRLEHRSQRMLISAAGMITETVVACWALLMWNFVAPGIVQTILLTLATTSLFLSLSVNLSPLMRFDGYFIFSDWLGMANLQQRSNMMAQWAIRRALWRWPDAAPLALKPRRQTTVILYAFAMWIYRFTLYMGIALAVYHLVFKALGIVLFCVEIAYFLVRPVVNEVALWVRQRNKITMNRRTIMTCCGAALLLGLLCFPWHTSVRAPAVWQAHQQQLFVARSAQLANIAVHSGQWVNAGQVLYRLRSPELDKAIAEQTLRLQSLQTQLNAYPFDKKASAELQIIRDQLTSTRQRLRQQIILRNQLTMRAPFSGRIVDVLPHLRAGDWLAAGQQIATLVDNTHSRVDAYIGERDLARLRLNAHAQFVAQDIHRAPVAVSLSAIATSSVSDLSAHPELSSPYGGALAARVDRRTHRPKAQQALYLATLTTAQSHFPTSVQRGVVVIEGRGQSIISRIGTAVDALLVRESVM